MALLAHASPARADEAVTGDVSSQVADQTEIMPTAGEPASQPTSQPSSQPAGLLPEQSGQKPAPDAKPDTPSAGGNIAGKQDKSGGFLKDDNDPGYLGRTVAAVLIVAVLGGAALVVSKKYLPRITRSPGRNVSVMETTHLGPGRAVHLVRVGGRKYLLSSSRDRVGMLADVSEAFPKFEVAEEKEPPKA